MKTGIGLFPTRDTAFINILQVLVEEGLYDSYINDEANSIGKHKQILNRGVAEHIGTIYEELVLKKTELESILDNTNKKAYSEKLWGPVWKRKEVNIVDNASEDDFVPSSGVSGDKLVKNELDRQEKQDIYEELNKKIDLENNLKEMQKLQEFFIIKEAVDFRALLKEYLNEEIENKEAETVLFRLISEYKYKIGEVLADYLYYRKEGMLSDDLRERLF